ncbi:glycosyltransferase [Leuconostoc pseudomesenteroides]|uniref:Glycosyltransferase n=1 Tax=Leuconostoc pseudomesenteroides TaxID=33968 RepID=A0ABT6HDH8_LEUPS|nr:glycosyltransferase [Leuconostoc pseudomesenteroides]MDG9734135.1 glycosyltransferase [Leuconostoc pseudomesenteroides]NKZ35336.1 glycosyltransferase family 4 protein [Leuconostoc pseudomesenteroides]QQB27779.1 glycosyltransferase [Leuconostoc pseudomesenteroides]
MKILHYALGFPPERTGGLVKYSLDLMNEQINQGHEVVMVFPGRVNFLKREPYFKFGKRQNIPYAELVNSLPLPLIGNIKNPQDFMKHTDSKVFINLLESEKPDVIHIHTLMGLYGEFLEEAKKHNIKIVFTTHDYFGISPHPKMYLDGHDFVEDKKYDIWNNIRSYGSRTIKLRINQLSIYPALRTLIKKLKKSSALVDDLPVQTCWSTEVDSGFQELKKYYLSMLKCVNIVHFNSSVSKKVYEQFLPNMTWKTVTLSISSNNIERSGEVLLLNKKINSIAYIGPYTEEKGFFKFLEFVKVFELENPNMSFFVMGDNSSVDIGKVTDLGRYDQVSFKKYMNKIDLVILPSQWHETFGLIAIEALSTGTKVAVASKMGASDIVPNWLQFDDMRNINSECIENKETLINILSPEEHFEKVSKLYVSLSS